MKTPEEVFLEVFCSNWLLRMMIGQQLLANLLGLGSFMYPYIIPNNKNNLKDIITII